MREKWRFHQDWYFTDRDVSDVLTKTESISGDELWESVTLPHSFRLEPYVHAGIATAQGIGVYCKKFTLVSSLEKKRLTLLFEAVMGVADVWLNGVLLHTWSADQAPDPGEEVHTHYGGYLPFVVCLNEAAKFDGTPNFLVVRADNRDHASVPPGKPQDLLDFTYFGGIYRNVWLEATEEVFITDPLYENVENGGGILLEYPQVSQERAVVSVKTHLRCDAEMDRSVTLTHQIVGGDGVTAANWSGTVVVSALAAADFTAELELVPPALWSPASPALYRLISRVYEGSTLLDEKTTRFGVRQIEVDRTRGLIINGQVQPLLSGCNRHQDFPVIGNAAPPSMQRRDAILFSQVGFGVVRAAHYPMSEDFLDACDELGLLLFEATPGWQWYPTDSPEPFSTRVRCDIRQMVRRDRNHPCVLAYEVVLNETYHVPRGFTRASALTALAEQRSARIAAESYGYDASPDGNGLDRESHFIFGFENPLEKTEKAVMFLREYCDSWTEAYGRFQSRRVTRGVTDGFYPSGEARNLQKANQMLWQPPEDDRTLAGCYALRMENPAFVGCAVWTGIDSRGAGSRISPCGIWDAFRLPKISYWAFASQHARDPVLFIASEWTEKAPVLDQSGGVRPFGTDGLRDIYVFSNAQTVVLSVERAGETLWTETRRPDARGEAAALPHPPFRFTRVPYTLHSLLRARGYDAGGNLIAQMERATAKTPRRLRVRAELLGVPVQADGNDLVLLHAEILDENDTLCTDADHRVFFQVEGDAVIVGTGDLFTQANPSQAEAGIASAYLRAGDTPGSVRVTASAKGLRDGWTEVLLTAPEYPMFPGLPFLREAAKLAGKANLTSHVMKGEARCLPLARAGGEVFMNSVRFSGTVSWELRGETCFRTGSRVLSGDFGAELLLYLDDVLHWRGKADRSGPLSLSVEGARILRAELRGTQPVEALLLSPYLWKSKTTKDESALRQNLAWGRPATATVHPQNAGRVWEGGVWLGGRPADEEQEWQVDLGDLFDVRSAMVHIGGQMGSDCTLCQYQIHTSSDGEHWKKQAENCRTSWSNGVTDHFTEKDVRFVKVVFTRVDGGLSAGIQKFEIYEDFGVDSVREYELSGIAVQGSDLVFSSDCLDYTLEPQGQLTIRALSRDPHARVSICGEPVPQPADRRITAVRPVTVRREDCAGDAVITVRAATGTGVREYHLHF